MTLPVAMNPKGVTGLSRMGNPTVILAPVAIRIANLQWIPRLLHRRAKITLQTIAAAISLSRISKRKIRRLSIRTPANRQEQIHLPRRSLPAAGRDSNGEIKAVRDFHAGTEEEGAEGPRSDCPSGKAAEIAPQSAAANHNSGNHDSPGTASSIKLQLQFDKNQVRR
jgi:hypothetical protein